MYKKCGSKTLKEDIIPLNKDCLSNMDVFISRKTTIVTVCKVLGYLLIKVNIGSYMKVCSINCQSVYINQTLDFSLHYI